MKDMIFDWANDWGRAVGIYGIQTETLGPGHHDDLDAFRHAFCHTVLVSLMNLGKPETLLLWLPLRSDIAKLASEIIGGLMEHPIMGASALPCPKQMDLHNNEIGKNLGLSKSEMIWIIGKGQNPIQAIAERVGRAVKAEQTINRLDDPRMPMECFSRARIPAGEYIWRTQADEKVRFNHAMLAGKQFHLNQPPHNGHPGTEYNCRCWAEPLVKPEKPKP